MRVVFATDGSSCAKTAAHFLQSVCFQSKPDLTLLTITYDPEQSNRPSSQPWLPTWRESQQNFVNQLHDELENRLAQKFSSISRVHAHGNVAHEILEHARQLDADLVVVGAVGHSLISRMLLGSVSDNVATHADCSVLVVRPPADDAAAAAAGGRITIAYDGSGAASEAITEISGLQWDPASEITVVSVLQEPDYLLAGGMSTNVIVNEEQFYERMRTTCHEGTQQASHVLPGAKSKTVRGHHVGEAIVRAAAENKSDLVVVGDAGHNLVDELILGSTAKYVLRHAPCSVWISRHHRNK